MVTIYELLQAKLRKKPWLLLLAFAHSSLLFLGIVFPRVIKILVFRIDLGSQIEKKFTTSSTCNCIFNILWRVVTDTMVVKTKFSSKWGYNI